MALLSIDPWGMPVATQVVSGERADDPLYVPAIKQVRNRLGVSGLLYVGDILSNAIDDKDLRAFTLVVYYHLCAIAV